jgi:hypothetical protein
MIVDNILAEIEAQEKQAAAAAPDPAKTAESQLSSALGETLTKVAAQAAPAAGNPVQDLFKLAEDIANSEKQAELQQSALMGRAFAHAAIEEFSAYDAAAKTAAAQAAPLPGLAEQAVKLAASDGELQKAAELGYQDAAMRVQQEVQIQGQNKEAQMETKLASVNIDQNVMEKMAQVGYAQTQEKVAAEQFQTGYNAAMGEVRDRAAEEFIKGAMEVDSMIQAAQG